MSRVIAENTATAGSMYAYWGSTARSAQKFTVPAGYSRIAHMSVNIRRSGTPGHINYSIYTDNGGNPGTMIGYEGGLYYTNVGTSQSWITLDFQDVDVTPGGTYWLVTRQPSSTSLSNAFYWDSAGNGSNGKYSTNSGASWSSLGSDWSYQIYGYGAPSGMAATTISNINNTSFTAASDVTDDMGYTVSSKGFCYSSSNATPTLADSSKVVNSGTGAYSTSITGLSAGTTYYIRSYATNAAGTSYGAVKTQATTYSAPTVTTSAITNIDKFTATFNGNVTSDNGSTVTERGFVYSTTTNPVIGGDSVTKQTVVGTTGVYLHNATSLSAKTTYYVKAYATNAAGTSYGSQTSFETLSAAPSVTSSGVTDLLDTTVTLGGNVTSDNGATVTERGIVYNISTNPTTANSKIVVTGTTGAYTGDATGLTPATTYYYRAYAINSYGTAYGENVTFKTEPSKPTSLTGTVVGKTQVDLAWVKGIGSTYTIVRRATGSYPATPGSGTSVYSGVGTFTSDTGLTAGTTYYYRAWGRDGSNNYSTETADITKTTDYGLTDSGNAYAEDSSYATAPSNDSKIYVSISKDGGTTWSPEIASDLPASNGVVTFGSSSSVLWGQTLTGDDIDDASFRVLVKLGSNKTSYQIFKDFGFSITSTYVLTGLEINIKGYFDTDTSYIDGVSAKCYYGTSVLPVKAGTQAFDSTVKELVLFDGLNWKQLLTSDNLPDSVVTTTGTQVLTNKTLTSPVINTPTGDVATLTGTQVLTNKTIDANSNTLKNVLPTGTILEYAGSTAPTGYLLCDGSAVSRTTYSNLFTVIGTTYGTGDGSTTFNVPNKKGRVGVGRDSSDTSFDTLGETGGEKTHTLSASEMPSHTHSVDPPSTSTNTTGGHTHTLYKVSAFAGGGGTGLNDAASGTGVTAMGSAGDHSHTVDIGSFTSGSAGSGSAHNNLPPYAVFNYIIKT